MIAGSSSGRTNPRSMRSRPPLSMLMKTPAWTTWLGFEAIRAILQHVHSSSSRSRRAGDVDVLGKLIGVGMLRFELRAFGVERGVFGRSPPR